MYWATSSLRSIKPLELHNGYTDYGFSHRLNEVDAVFGKSLFCKEIGKSHRIVHDKGIISGYKKLGPCNVQGFDLGADIIVKL